VGWQWTRAGIKRNDWSVNVISARYCQEVLDESWGDLRRIKVGTMICWDKVFEFDRLRQNVGAYISYASAGSQREVLA